MPQSRPASAARAAIRPDPRWLWSVASLSLAAVLAAQVAWGQDAVDGAPEDVDGDDGTVTTTHGYAFFGNLVHGPDIPHLPYVNPDAPKGGEMSTWAQGTFDTFNIYTIEGNAAALAGVGQETLLTSVADDPVGQYCFLCTSLTYPESLDWVIFDLRDDVTFSDGSPMTADDLLFSYDLFMEQGLESFRLSFGSMIAGVEVLGPHRIRFDFTDEAPLRDRIGLAGGFPVLSRAWFGETGQRLDALADEPFLGTGPYVLESSDPGRQVVYARDPDYWGNDLPLNIGRNNFDRIRVEYFADNSVAIEAFKAGEFTFINENSSLNWATAYDIPAVADGTIVKVELPNGNMPTAQSFVFNLRRPVFEDPKVREAIGLGFNFEWSNATLFYGLYTRTIGFWNVPELGATGTPGPDEVAILQPLVDEGLLPASILTDEAVMPPTSNEAANLDRANLRRASQLLDEAGWIVGEDGIRTKDGERLEVVFLESSPTFERVILPYVENLIAMGVDARLDLVDPAQEEARRASSDFDMAVQGFSMDWEPSTGVKQWFGSEGAAESNRNLMGLTEPAVDRLTEIVANATTDEEMKSAVRALDRVLRSYRFWVPQWYKPVHTVAYYDIYDHPDPLPPYALGNIDFWWYDAARADELRAAGALK